MDTVTILFWIFLPLTLAGLCAAVFTGKRGKRRLHLILAPSTLGLLAVTIFLAEQMGRVRIFPEDELRIHLWFAQSAAVLALPVIFTGIMLVRRPGWRRVHFVCVLLFLAVAVTATCTGVWAFSLSTPK